MVKPGFHVGKYTIAMDPMGYRISSQKALITKIIWVATWIWAISAFACTKKSETHIHFGTSISTSTKSTHPKQKSEKTQPIHMFQLVFF